MSPTIRNLIINYLHLHQSATVPELASALNVTPQDIRYNLKPLFEEHLVEKTSTFSRAVNQGRGRPSVSLRLTTKGQPNNYLSLASALLRDYLNRTSDLPDKGAAKLAELVFSQPIQDLGNLTQNLTNMIQILNDHQYRAHWEAHASGPRIIFDNCPYAEILQNFPILLCAMDREFLSQMTDIQVEQLQRFDTSKRKPPICLFRLASKPH